jgi:type VI secretion system secreted protein Hcp
MRLGMIRTLVVALSLGALASAPARADEIVITVHSAKNGDGKLRGSKVSFEVVVPRDPATGQATGKRQHKPFVITKEWGAASPMDYRALLTGEAFPTVLIEFFKTAPNGTKQLDHTVKLTNASISGIKRYASGAADLEDISLTFQHVEFQDEPGQPPVGDDW